MLKTTRKTLLTAAAVIFSGSLHANTLTLQVVDDGEPLPMAEVILIDSETNQILDSQFTDTNGLYAYAKMHERVNILVTKDEYAKKVVKNVALNQAPINKKLNMVLQAFADNNPGYGDNGEGCDD